MTPERYKQVDELFQAALERPSQERAVFLDQVCSADPDLRREIEVLLSSDKQTSSLIESPALELAPELMADQKSVSLVGQSIGPYRVSALLGSGGMGAVFLAEHAKLGRNVALKLLPEYFTADEQRLRRFQQEARAASSLNHPNIITIFDIGAVEGKPGCSGQTRRDQIAEAGCRRKC